jgi:futalosine hydrolase
VKKEIMIALLCSVKNEAELLLSHTAATRTCVMGSKPVTEGTIAGQQVAVCLAGMGKVNAAHAATLLLTRYSPEALVVFGIGGAYLSSGARVGDVVLATEEISGDEGVLTLEGFKDTEYIGIPLLKNASSVFYNSFPAPEALAAQSYQALLTFEQAGRGRVLRGIFVTLSSCTGTAARAGELEDRYHGICENMEGAAVAQVASLHGVPWVEIRGISNMVEERDLEQWDVRAATHAVQNAVIHLLEGWGRAISAECGVRSAE